MKVLLGQLAPAPGEVSLNIERIRRSLAEVPADLAVFPELFLTGYRVGDRVHQLAVRAGDANVGALRHLAAEKRSVRPSASLSLPVSYP